MSGACFTHDMRRRAGNASRAVRSRLAEDLANLCADAGVSQRTLSTRSGVDAGYISRLLAGSARPSIETYARLAGPLGADLVARLYPNTGPLIRDRHQARMLEFLLEQRHPRWEPATEVAVARPSRGVIDLVLRERREGVIVAAELQSELRRLEQVIRWSQQKAESLPSSRIWLPGDDTTATSRLLVVRRTRATRSVASEFRRQLDVAYPAHPDDALDAITGIRSWPGASLIWLAIEGNEVRFVSGR